MRADVILLFFDPDKPGTTGETLTILTNALSGMDHKLYIILNKADQFTKIHDFARAYGSLCWNLSKVWICDAGRIYKVEYVNNCAYFLINLGHTKERPAPHIHNVPSNKFSNYFTKWIFRWLAISEGQSSRFGGDS
jgi:hypothetical protein